MSLLAYRVRFLAKNLPRVLARDLRSSWAGIRHNLKAIWLQSDPRWLDRIQQDWAELEAEEARTGESP